MADIFLSYAKEDREVARKLSVLLEHAGWSVWWDRRIPAGRTWRDVLEDALRDMGCMVVLWSSNSIDSDWVREEAEEARARKKLVPVLIESVNPPVGFRTIQAADLTDWDGVAESPGARQLIADLALIIGQTAVKATAATTPMVSLSGTDAPNERKTRAVDVQQLKPSPEPQDRAGVRAAEQRGIPWKFVTAGGAAAAALALALFLLWPDRTPVTEELPTAVATTPAEPVAEAAPMPSLVRLSIYGEREDLNPDEGTKLSLRGRYSDGSESDISGAIEWSSSDAKVARIDGAGRLTALQPGSAKITAAYGGLNSPAWSLNVKAPPPKPAPAPTLVTLTIDADKKDIAPRERIVLRAAGKFSDGSKKSIAGGVDWSTSDSAIASVNGRGELEARRAGKTAVVARSGNVASAPFWVVVKEPVVKPVVPPERKYTDTTTMKAPEYATVERPPPPRPVAPPVNIEALRAKITPYVSQARDYRVRGNYVGALAALSTARSVAIPGGVELVTDIDREIEQTKRACLAEKRLGRMELDCG